MMLKKLTLLIVAAAFAGLASACSPEVIARNGART